MSVPEIAVSFIDYINVAAVLRLDFLLFHAFSEIKRQSDWMAPVVSYFLILMKLKLSFVVSFVYNDFRFDFESSGINDCVKRSI